MTEIYQGAPVIETEMSYYASSPEFGRAETRSALVDLINALESPANAHRLDQGGIRIHKLSNQLRKPFPELKLFHFQVMV